MALLLDILLRFLIVALIDYPGYNGTKDSKTALKIYRAFHGFLVLGLGVDLYIRHGIYAPFLFGGGCWCFINDWLYYFIAYILNLKRKPFADEGRELTLRMFKAKRIAHAWWTPIGLFYNFRDYELPFKEREKPSAAQLWAQSALSLIFITFVSLAL